MAWRCESHVHGYRYKYWFRAAGAEKHAFDDMWKWLFEVDEFGLLLSKDREFL